MTQQNTTPQQQPAPANGPTQQQPAPQQPAPVVTETLERPDGIEDAAWDAMGDPGKRALVRERAARTAAERDAAIARARPTPPPGRQTTQQQPGQPGQQVAPGGQAPGTGTQNDQGAPAGGGFDINALTAAIGQAIDARLAPILQAEETRQADAAAGRIVDAVTAAANGRMHNPSDALAHLNLGQLTDGSGGPDDAKIAAAVTQLLTDRPYLAKPGAGAPLTSATPGVGAQPGGSTAPLETRTQDALTRMQRSTGVRLPSQNT